ncbi:MAG: histidine kinase dimerization/phospho-acceptor domain-containing protein, partial [Bradymonadaceae bacterium]
HDGDPRLQERANEAAATFLDVSPSRLEKEPLTKLFDGDEVADLTADLADTGDRLEFETSLSDRLGEIAGVDIRVEVTPLASREDGGPAQRLLWLIRDPSDLQTVDTRLQRLQQDATLGRMASGITHEFKNILGIISTWTELGLRDEDVSDSVRTALRKISHAANRGSTLTDSLLSYGQKNEINPTNLDVNRLLRSNAETFQALLPGRVAVDLDLEEGPLYVHFDENHFEQVLLNLVLNARDAIQETGTITCRSREISLTETNPEVE